MMIHGLIYLPFSPIFSSLIIDCYYRLGIFGIICGCQDGHISLEAVVLSSPKLYSCQLCLQFIQKNVLSKDGKTSHSCTAKKKGVTKIHSNQFFYDKSHVASGSHNLMPISYVGKVTFHYINNPAMARRMTCDVAVYWKWPIKGCDGVKRDGMPHLRLS